jgi:hypothetical protein
MVFTLSPNKLYYIKLVRLIKMCLYETYSKVHIGKNLCDESAAQHCLKQGEALSPLLFIFALDAQSARSKESGRTGFKWNPWAIGLCWLC